MATNSTKILQYDLEDWIFKLLDELKKIQGTHKSFESVFKNINVGQMTGDTKKVIQDLIDGYNNDSKGLTIERIQKIENGLNGMSNDLMIEGNTKEKYTYDETTGDVIKEEVSGDRNYVVDYIYTAPTEPDAEPPEPEEEEEKEKVLTKSIKKFLNNKNQQVTITKEYKYDALGNIVEIDTVTEIDTQAPGEVLSLNISNLATSVLFNWDPPTDVDFSHIMLYIEDEHGFVYPPSEKTSQTFTASGLSDGVMHYIRVTTVDTGGNESVGVTQSFLVQRAGV